MAVKDLQDNLKNPDKPGYPDLPNKWTAILIQLIHERNYTIANRNVSQLYLVNSSRQKRYFRNDMLIR